MTDPGQRGKMLRAALRRGAWIVGLVVVTTVVTWRADNGIMAGAKGMWSTWETVDITGYQAAWTTLSIASVLAVYWWGVGTGSRYEPPAMSALKPVEMVPPTPAKAVLASGVAATKTITPPPD